MNHFSWVLVWLESQAPHSGALKKASKFKHHVVQCLTEEMRGSDEERGEQTYSFTEHP